MGSAYLALGYTCNHKCICCPLTTYDRLHRPLSFDDIKERVELIFNENSDNLQYGQNQIVLSGGEPMLHEDFIRTVDMLEQKGFFVTVLSNSSQCVDKQLVKNIRNVISDDRFEVITAIHSSDPLIHDNITGVQGSLLESLEGLDNLLNEGIHLTIKHIFSKMSLFTLDDTFKYLEEHYPPKVGFQFCTMDYSGMAKKNIDRLFVTINEIKPYIENTLDYLEGRMSKMRRISIIESPFCMVDPYYWKYYKTTAGASLTYAAPNTDEDKVIYNLKSECGANHKQCCKCVVQKWCPGTWNSAFDICGGDLVSPISETVC